jgi:hypothetical protein
MDSAAIYAKTELGLREIKERSLKLPVPMRGLLIMIDGHRTVADVLEKAKMLRLDSSALEALEVGGLIAQKLSAPSMASNDEEMASRSDDEVKHFLRAQQRLSDAINEHLGLRGYTLMLKLQKTANLRDLHDVLLDFAAALVRRVGMDKATPIVSAIEDLVVRK